MDNALLSGIIPTMHICSLDFKYRYQPYSHESSLELGWSHAKHQLSVVTVVLMISVEEFDDC